MIFDWTYNWYGTEPQHGGFVLVIDWTSVGVAGGGGAGTPPQLALIGVGK